MMTTEDMLKIAAIADMVTGLTEQTAAEVLASAVITVAKDRSNNAERFAAYAVDMIEEGMRDAVPVHRSRLTS